MSRKFAVFIISANRPNNVITIDTLRRHGYTGDIYLLIDDTDIHANEYRKNYENVILLNKAHGVEITDTGDNFKEKTNAVVFARNLVNDVAIDLGLTHYLVCDDDYTTFSYRYNKNGQAGQKSLYNLDYIFSNVLDFLDVTGAKSVAFAQGGDLIGGISGLKNNFKRKAMNTFFVGRIDLLSFTDE